MAQLPSYVRLLRDNAAEQFSPGVVVSDMDRGLQKMRISQSKVVVQVAATLLFRSRRDTIAFEEWYFDTIRRIGWFDWHDPRSRTMRTVRFRGGDIGSLTPLAARYAIAKRSVILEYLR